MSLINEALKKAQRQRSLDNAPLSSAPSGIAAAAVTTHVPAATRRRSNAAPVWFGLGLLVLGVGATAIVMRYGFPDTAPGVAKPTPLPAPAPVIASAAPNSVSPAAVVAPATPDLAANEPAVAEIPKFSLPVAPAPAPKPAPAAATPTPTQPPAPSTAAAAVAPTSVAPVAAPRSPAERRAQVYAFLDTLRITGVRGQGNQARVLMNERVFRLNETVSNELGLRLTDVRPNLLVFTDSQGATYEKAH